MAYIHFCICSHTDNASRRRRHVPHIRFSYIYRAAVSGRGACNNGEHRTVREKCLNINQLPLDVIFRYFSRVWLTFLYDNIDCNLAQYDVCLCAVQILVKIMKTRFDFNCTRPASRIHQVMKDFCHASIDIKNILDPCENTIFSDKQFN